MTRSKIVTISPKSDSLPALHSYGLNFIRVEVWSTLNLWHFCGIRTMVHLSWNEFNTDNCLHSREPWNNFLTTCTMVYIPGPKALQIVCLSISSCLAHDLQVHNKQWSAHKIYSRKADFIPIRMSNSVSCNMLSKGLWCKLGVNLMLFVLSATFVCLCS